MKWSSWLTKIKWVLATVSAGSLLLYVSLRMHARFMQEKTWSSFARILWEFKVYDSANLTVGKIVTVVCLISLGFISARWLSHRLVHSALSRLKVNRGAIAAVDNLAYYALLFAFSLGALHVAEVPLTIFAFLGGALAIGLGFGSQNLLSNFISGIILQIAQPVKVGDLIEIEGAVGTVEHIGGRSTRILSSNNTYVIVPNSYFLDKKFINSTLNEQHLRIRVDLAVDFETEISQLEQMIAEALAQFPEILDVPEPKISLVDYGQQSLKYSIVFWVALDSSTRKDLESNFRKMLWRKLKAAGIKLPRVPGSLV